MLEQLRRQSRSFIIWILFGIIIVVFVISFGPQANAQVGCGASEVWVMKVGDREIGQHSWRFAMNGLSYVINTSRVSKPQRAELAMDLLLQRELLASAADRNGFRITEDQASERIVGGEWYVLGYRLDGKSAYYQEGEFDYDRLESIAHSMGLPSAEQFIAQQQREFLAEAMKGLLVGSVYVSREELLTSYTHEHTTAKIEYVKFRPAEYKRALELGEDQVAAYIARHHDEVEARYQADESTYKGVKPQVHIRQIFFARVDPLPVDGQEPAPVDEGDDPAAVKEDDPAAVKEDDPAAVKEDDPAAVKEDDPAAVEKDDPAQAKAIAARKKISGGASFATVAKALSEDERSAAKGGDLGWRTVERPGLGDPKLVEVLATLDPGQLSEVVETRRGFYLLEVVAKREGDLGFDQVKDEIAEKLARDYYAREGARRDAEAALAQLTTGKKLEELFERGEAAPELPPGFDLEQLKQQLPPGTDVEEFLRSLQNQRGALMVEGPDIQAAAEGEAAPVATPAAATPTPVAKPATGAVPSTPAPADEVIPKPAELAPPTINESGPFPRDLANVPGVGDSAELVGLIFDELEVGAVVDHVIEVDDGFALVRLATRQNPDLDQFAKTEPDLLRSHKGGKAIDTVQQWVTQRCKAVVASREVAVNQAFLQFDDDSGKPLPITYQPCQNL